MAPGRARARFWRALGVAAALTACGDGGRSDIDAGRHWDAAVIQIDAGPSCRELSDQWWEAVAAAGVDCEVDGDCDVVDTPDQFCDCHEGISEWCGTPVARTPYAEGAGPGLEAEWERRGCHLDGVCDCPLTTPRCSAGQCAAEERSCFAFSTRNGTILVAEVQLDGHPELGSGAHVSISYEDPESPRPAYDDMVPPGIGCVVLVYDTSAALSPSFDEGTVDVTATMSPVPTCAYDSSHADYRCAAATGSTEVGDAVAPAAATHADVTLASAPFAATHVGMYLELSGADDPAADGSFPIVTWTSATTVTIARSGLASPTQWSVPGSYAVVAGRGPTEASVDFLGDSDLITIDKAIGPETDPFSTVLLPGGVGFLLDDASDSPAALPVDGRAVDLGCDGAGGECGMAQSTLVFGRTTTADVTGLPFDAMPPSTTGSYARWRCRSFGTRVEIPADVMAIVLGTGPTRIETRVVRANLGLEGNSNGTNLINIAAGHEIAGYTDVPPSP